MRIICPELTHVRTLAGGPRAGFIDGSLEEALFNKPEGLSIDVDGCVMIADRQNNAVRVLRKSDGKVSTLAGGSGWGNKDGFSPDARFNFPADVCVVRGGGWTGMKGREGGLLIADSGNHCLRLSSRVTLESPPQKVGCVQSCQFGAESSCIQVHSQPPIGGTSTASFLSFNSSF